MKRPSIRLKCPADSQHGHGERIAEFHFENGIGGLIALTMRDGDYTIEIYRVDPQVKIVARRAET